MCFATSAPVLYTPLLKGNVFFVLLEMNEQEFNLGYNAQRWEKACLPDHSQHGPSGSSSYPSGGCRFNTQH